MSLTEEVIGRVLKAHNEYRKIHKAKPLKYSPYFGKIAHTHALKLAKKETLEHCNAVYEGTSLGENLARWKADVLYQGGELIFLIHYLWF
jgi:uncharacterized protein YkwD